MIKLSLTGGVVTGCSRFLLGLTLLALLGMNTGCSFSAKPSKSVETLCRAVESGEVDRAATFFSSGFISKLGIEVLKENLSRFATFLKNVFIQLANAVIDIPSAPKFKNTRQIIRRK